MEEGTLENESGFSDASGAVEDEGLMDSVVLSVVVEDCFEEGSGNDPPWFFCCHFFMLFILLLLFVWRVN